MLQTLFPLLIFLFPLAYSPGPGNMTFAASGARFGLRATLPANLGYHICAWIITAAIGFGAYQAAQSSPALFKIVQALGALYVLWLAFRFLMAGASDNSQAAKPMCFWDGVVLMALNPKA